MEETARIRVRPLELSDLADYQHILMDPRLASASGQPATIAPNLLAYWFEKDRHSPYAFAVIDRRERRFVGTILYYQHGNQANVYDLGYFLTPHVWGHGIMPVAVRASLRLITREGGQVTRLFADCLPDNHRSQRVLEKLGFTLVPGITAAPNVDRVNWYSKTLLPSK